MVTSVNRNVIVQMEERVTMSLGSVCVNWAGLERNVMKVTIIAEQKEKNGRNKCS